MLKIEQEKLKIEQEESRLKRETEIAKAEAEERVYDDYILSVQSPVSHARAVASVRQGGRSPLNFGLEVQYFDEFLKKAGLYALFLYCHSE